MEKKECRNCPSCIHWWFDRMKRGCNNGHKLTNTTYQMGTEHAIGHCGDFENRNKPNKTLDNQLK